MNPLQSNQLQGHNQNPPYPQQQSTRHSANQALAFMLLQQQQQQAQLNASKSPTKSGATLAAKTGFNHKNGGGGAFRAPSGGDGDPVTGVKARKSAAKSTEKSHSKVNTSLNKDRQGPNHGQSSRQDSRGRANSSKRRQAQPVSTQDIMVRALDQQLMQGQALPVFVPQNQAIFNNYMSEQPKIAGKRVGAGSLFNQTANLVGLSSHLLGTDFDEDIEEDQSKQAISKHKQNSQLRGGSGSRKRTSGVSGNQQLLNYFNSSAGEHQNLSETQNIDISSLHLMPLLLNNNAIPTQTRRATAPGIKKKNKTIERTTLKQLNHSHMSLEQQPLLSLKSTQQINIPQVNPKNFKSTSGLDQHQARLDELISHVKAAAAVVAGYHTSTNTTATAALVSGTSTSAGAPTAQQLASTTSFEKASTSSVSLKRKPSMSKKSVGPASMQSNSLNQTHLLPDSVGSKKLSLKQQVQSYQNQILANKKAQSSIRGEVQDAMKKQQPMPNMFDVNAQRFMSQNQLQDVGANATLYKNLTQKMIKEHQQQKVLQNTSDIQNKPSKISVAISKKGSSVQKQSLQNTQPIPHYVLSAAENEESVVSEVKKHAVAGKSLKRSVNLNQTQVIGMNTSTNKNQKNFVFEAVNNSVEVPVQQTKKRKSTAGPVGASKKSLNLTGTIPKDILNINIGPQPKYTIATQNSYQYLHSSNQQLRNHGSVDHHDSIGQQQPVQNIIYSDIGGYNVINTFIGCFPPNFVPPQQNQAEQQYQDIQEMQIHSVRQNIPQQSNEVPPQTSQKKGSHQKNSTLPNAAVLILNEILQNNQSSTNQHKQSKPILKPNESITVGQTPRCIGGDKITNPFYPLIPQGQQLYVSTDKKRAAPRAMSSSNSKSKQILSELQSSIQKHSQASTIEAQPISNFNASTHHNTSIAVQRAPQNAMAVDEIDIDLGTILQPEKKAQTIKLRNISKILDNQIHQQKLQINNQQDQAHLNSHRVADEQVNIMQDYEDDDIHVTSGCGVITMTLQSEKPDAPINSKRQTNGLKETISSPNHLESALPQITQKLKGHKRQRSRSNGSNSTGGAQDSRSRSLGRATYEDIQQQIANLKYPITPAKALKLFMNHLTDHEKGEILDYKQVYFLGLGAQKIKGSPLHPYNFGYDDERGDYKVVLGDHIAYRFEVQEFLGKGSFGQAIKCFDHKTKEHIAIKLIRNKKRFQHQAGVELKILMHLKQNDPDDAFNIIRIKDYVVFRKHLVIGFELFSINLYEFIKNNNFVGVSLSLIRRFAIQILQALKYLREQSIIHCDLKPENILLKSPDKSGIKVIDFGSSCFQDERIYTYIQSRFYRAPEIILGIPYTPAIDMWSLGCILVELFTGYPIFPGENEHEQLSMIMEVRGLPPEQILDQSTRGKIFFDEETDEPLLLSSDSRGKLRIPGSKPLQRLMECPSQSFVDFIERCLDWDPSTRITPFEALMHEWIIEGLPPKVLLHHKRMLGIYDDEVFNLEGGFGRAVAPKANSQKPQIKDKLMNRTCLVTDAIKSDEPLVDLPKHNIISQRGKSLLNKTGVIVIKPKDELINDEQDHSDNLSSGPLLMQQPKKTFKMPPVLKGKIPQISQAKKIPASSDYFIGEKEKSKTTNIADILSEVKRIQNKQDDPPIVGAGEIKKFDNTYDLSKLKKGTCLSQNGILNYGNDDKLDPQECHLNQHDDDLDDVESALVPFDEREQLIHVGGEDSHFKKQQKSKLPFSFMMKNYPKSTNKPTDPQQTVPVQDHSKQRRQQPLDLEETTGHHPHHQPKVKMNNFMTNNNTTTTSASMKGINSIV